MRRRTGITAAGLPIDRDPEPETLKPSEQADRYNRPGVYMPCDVVAFTWAGAIYCPACADGITDTDEPPTVAFRDSVEEYEREDRREGIELFGEDPGPVSCHSCGEAIL